MFSTAFAVLEIPNAQPKVHANEWKLALDKTWQGLKTRNIDAYSTGLVHRPKSETPGDAVSEGVGYGMLLALYANDQVYFDKIWAAGKRYMGATCPDWRVNQNGTRTGYGPASDADEDIGLALIFADKLVKKGKWNSTSESTNYYSNAQAVIKCLFENQVYDWKLLRPGKDWGAPPVNPGYFAPAWYRIFAEFDNDKSHTWMAIVEESYRVLRANPVYDLGMVPDWTGNNGEFYPDGPGYNPYFNGTAFFKDAIRILWRIANDYLWFEEPRAKEFLDNSLAFIKLKGGPSAANFYQLQGTNRGELVPAEDKWTQFNGENNSNTWRYRREHSHLTIGQWLTVAMAVGSNEEKVAWSNEMAKFYDFANRVDFFGQATDPTGGLEDTLHNEMYFDQFLAWFGVSLMSGTWVNVIELLDNPVSNDDGIPGKPSSVKPLKPANFNIQISQKAGVVLMSSQSNAVWKIHNLQGKLLFSSNSKEAAWNAGNFKGTVAVSATSKSGSQRELLVVK
jgi:endo-1,4-beta-D-glucanase Y